MRVMSPTITSWTIVGLLLSRARHLLGRSSGLPVSPTISSSARPVVFPLLRCFRPVVCLSVHLPPLCQLFAFFRPFSDVSQEPLALFENFFRNFLSNDKDKLCAKCGSKLLVIFFVPRVFVFFAFLPFFDPLSLFLKNRSFFLRNSF